MDSVYSTTQAALTLDIGKSTVNKYSRDLEARGYSFLRDGYNHRAFTEHDLVAFRVLIEKVSSGMNYERAVEIVAERYSRSNGGQEVTELAMPQSTIKLNDINEQLTALMTSIQVMAGNMDRVVKEQVSNEIKSLVGNIQQQAAEQQRELLERMEDMERRHGEDIAFITAAHKNEVKELMQTFADKTELVARGLEEISDNLKQEQNKQGWFKRIFKS